MPTATVVRSDVWWEEIYRQADVRESAWFCGASREDGRQYYRPGVQCAADPGLPSLEVLRARIEPLIEEAPWGQTCTCSHGGGESGTSKIRIPSDKWDSGCVPHEMLHAAMYHLRHLCKSDIEHDDHYSVSSCRSR